MPAWPLSLALGGKADSLNLDESMPVDSDSKSQFGFGTHWQDLTDGERSLTGLARKAREIYRVRARRAQYFPDTALGEAAWDMLLSLFADAVEGRPTSTKSIGIFGGVPVSTCLSILSRLESDGLVVRMRDDADRRVTKVLISPTGLLMMRDYLLNETISNR